MHSTAFCAMMKCIIQSYSHSCWMLQNRLLTSWSATADSECASNIAIVWQTVWKQACNCGVCVRPQVCKARAIWRMKCTVTELGGFRGNVRCSSLAQWKARRRLPISHNWTFFARCFCFVTIHTFDGQPTIARCDLTKSDAHKKQNVTYFWHDVTVSVESKVETTLGRILGD